MRLITGILSFLALGLILFYIAPAGWKEKAADSINKLDFVPEAVKDKTAGILLTPPQRRERLIQELEQQLESLAAAVGQPIKQGASAIGSAVGSAIGTPEEIIAKAEKILQKIKTSNDDPNMLEQLQKLAASKDGCDKEP